MIQKMREIKPFPLRMPSDLRDWYENEANIDRRALNFILVETLKENKERTTQEREALNANIQ